MEEKVTIDTLMSADKSLNASRDDLETSEQEFKVSDNLYVPFYQTEHVRHGRAKMMFFCGMNQGISHVLADEL